jgi:hypothetical protein
MNKRFSIVASLLLMLIGALALMCNLAMFVPGARVFRWAPWRLWPLVVVCAGLFLVVPPLLVRGRRGLGGLFIPGVPILTSGAILLFASVFDAWRAWEWLWPLEILALAVGYLLAAIYMRVIWLLIPAAFFGVAGAPLQFCALTGWWGLWGVLWRVGVLRWVVEIGAPAVLVLVGLSILIGGIVRRPRAVGLVAE